MHRINGMSIGKCIGISIGYGLWGNGADDRGIDVLPKGRLIGVQLFMPCIDHHIFSASGGAAHRPEIRKIFGMWCAWGGAGADRWSVASAVYDGVAMVNMPHVNE